MGVSHKLKKLLENCKKIFEYLFKSTIYSKKLIILQQNVENDALKVKVKE